MPEDNHQPQWDEASSDIFIEYGDYMVVDRAYQHDTFVSLMDPPSGPFTILELCCGAGGLAERLLDAFPEATLLGYDGSPTMLAAAQERLKPAGSRFQTHQFDLAKTDWRHPNSSLHAVVSSLAIHHLDGHGKQTLFNDVYQMLAPNGRFLIADLVAPNGALSTHYAAERWNHAIREQSLAGRGDTEPFDYFDQHEWNIFTYPDPMDMPSPIFDQLTWLRNAGFVDVDIFWLKAGHAIYGGRRGN